MNQHENEYALWLPSWYPNKLAPFEGDFIRRQAEAVSAFYPVQVVYVVKDEKRQITNSQYVEYREAGNLRETIIYYASPADLGKPIERFISVAKWGKICRRIIKGIINEYGLPSIVHVHVALKGGLIGRWIRRTYGIPYLLSEHWTIYLEEAKPKLIDLSFTKQYLISKVVLDASAIITVSQHLSRAIEKKWPALRYEVIPNVVDKRIFFPATKHPSAKLKLVHASAMNYQKDPESLIRAAGLLKQRNIPFILDLFGTPEVDINELIRKLGVENEVKWHGEIAQEDLSEYFRQADALILYSRFETFGCVIIEANASGIPVVVPDTSLMHELVLNGVNGVFVPPGSPEALANKLAELAQNKFSFDPSTIEKTTDQYNYENVGNKVADLYREFIEQNAVT